jgi:predicted PurR-regulated permease PerM
MAIEWYMIPALILIVALVVMFLAKKYILLASDVLLKVLFVLCAVVALSALFWPVPYQFLAEQSLRAAGTESTFLQIDEQIGKVDPQNWWDKFDDLFGGSTSNNTNAPAKSNNYLMQQVYPGLVQSVAAVWRVIGFVLSVIIMLFGTYLSYSTYAASKIVHLERELAELKRRFPPVVAEA